MLHYLHYLYLLFVIIKHSVTYLATFASSLQNKMKEYLRPDHVKVDCVGLSNDNNSDNPQATNAHVIQTHVKIPSMDRYIISLIEILQWAMSDNDDDTNPTTRSSSTLITKTHNKIVVFFPVARMVSYFSAVFQLVLGIDVVEMHSRKSQSYRNNASNKFREALSGIMFTSDVSARGEYKKK